MICIVHEIYHASGEVLCFPRVLPFFHRHDILTMHTLGSVACVDMTDMKYQCLLPVPVAKMAGALLSEFQRNRILVLHGQGLSTHAIARRIHCNQASVARTLARYRRTGSTKQSHSTGRPTRFTPQQQRQAWRIMRRHAGETAAAIAVRLMDAGLPRVTPRTIQLLRRSHRFRPVSREAVYPLNEGVRQRRLDWCWAQRSNRFGSTIFVDEKWWRIDNRGKVFWLQDDQPRPVIEEADTKISIGVWGGIWPNGRTDLHFIQGSVNRFTYTNILATSLLPHMRQLRRYTLLHDNARAHSARHTREWLTANNVRYYDDYPPYSPELNAIELVWGWMKNYVTDKMPRNALQLAQYIQQAWDAIPQAIICTFIDHIPHNIQGIIAAQGGHIGE